MPMLTSQILKFVDFKKRKNLNISKMKHYFFVRNPLMKHYYYDVRNLHKMTIGYWTKSTDVSNNLYGFFSVMSQKAWRLGRFLLPYIIFSLKLQNLLELNTNIYIYTNLAYLVSVVQLYLLAGYFTIFIYKAYKWKVRY